MDFFADHASLIRFIVILIIVLLLGGRYFWREFQAKYEEMSDKPSYLLSQRSVSVVELSRVFLFADHTVEQHINNIYTKEPSRNDFKTSCDYLFALNSYHSRKGNKRDAGESLKQVLTLPEASSRSILVAWKALRALGQIPDAGTARKPLGVVIELPVGKRTVLRKKVDMIAAYSDGTAEYISHNGEITDWATPDEETRLLTSDILRASEPIVKTLPVSEYHRASYKNLIRISILTPGGIRTAEAKPDGLRRDPAMASVVDAGRRLIETLTTKGENLGLHIDLKFSGDILVSRDGQAYKVISVDQLKSELQQVKREGSFVFYTREHPEQEPPAALMNTFKVIADSGVRIRMLGPPK